jgi:hypothetical protein
LRRFSFPISDPDREPGVFSDPSDSFFNPCVAPEQESLEISQPHERVSVLNFSSLNRPIHLSSCGQSPATINSKEKSWLDYSAIDGGIV